MTTLSPDFLAVLPVNGLPDLIVFTDTKGKNRLGEIAKYPAAEVNAAFAQKCYLVNDIITGIQHKKTIASVKAIEVPKGTFKSYMPGDMVITDAWREHWSAEADTVDAALKEFGVGASFTRPVGDGCAHYVVTKVNKTTCHVEWRGFSADNWVDQVFGYGGSFKRSLVERLCGSYPVKHVFAHRRHPDGVTWAEVEATGLVPKGMLS